MMLKKVCQRLPHHRQIVPLKRSGLLITMLLLLLITAGSSVTWASTPEDMVRDHIKHADTYYWFAMAEKGNMDSFNKGLAHLDAAENILKTNTLDAQAAADYQKQIHALRIDIENQSEVHFDTLYGMFPLVRLLAPSLFADALAAGTFELADDPTVMASTAAAMDLADKVIKNWTAMPQLNVIFTSSPDNKALENEVLYVFNLSPKFFVHNYKELVTALTPEELQHFETAAIADKITPAIENRLCQAFSMNEFLMVGVTELDKIDKDHFYLLEGRIYNSGKSASTRYFYNMGFSRDRNQQLWPIIITNFLLLLAAVVVYTFFVIRDGSQKLSPAVIVAPPAIGFLIGRVLPWVTLPMISTFAPLPETLAKLSFWWPSVAGIVLFMAPAVVYHILAARARAIFPRLKGQVYRERALFVAIALGACAYLAAPLYLYLESDALWILLPVAVCGGSALYTAGRVFDPQARLGAAHLILPVLVTLALGSAVSHLAPVYLWICAGVALTPLLIVRRHRTSEPRLDIVKDQNAIPVAAIPIDITELIKRTAHPAYVEPEAFAQVVAAARPVIENRTAWLGLCGPVGVGKTTTADELITDLQDRLDQEIVLLKGACPQHATDEKGAVTPYTPFRAALADHVDACILAPSDDQVQQLNKVIEEVAGSIPLFGSMILPAAEEDGHGQNSQEAVFTTITKAIRDLSRSRTVVLFIDDIQWLDPSSGHLLTHLLKEFPFGGDARLLMLFTSRDEAVCARYVQHHFLELPEPSMAQREKILVASLRLDTEVAQTLNQSIGDVASVEGNLFWLLRVVSHLAEYGYLEKGPNGYGWSDKYRPGTPLPLPKDYQEALERLIEKAAGNRPVLECAACLGQSFSASVLARSMQMPEIDLLRALNEIESQTGIIYDVPEKDDIFAFRSSYLFEVIRRNMRISGHGPKAVDVPQLIRAYHYQLARTLEKTLTSSADKVYEVARHYYAAGAAHAREGLQYCLLAANSAKQSFLFDRAFEYIDMAAECAEKIPAEFDAETEDLIIECYRVHVLKDTLQKTADKCWDLINARPDPPARMLICGARTCFDFAREEGNQEYFKRTVEIGKMILSRAETPVEEAEARQLIELAMPRGKEHIQERIANMRTAIQLLEPLPEDDPQALSLYARIADSLAGLLTYGPLRNEKEAEDLLCRSIDIKSRPEISDQYGLALSHGSMGRLHQESARIALEHGQTDSATTFIEQAREYFRNDLEISIKIKDLQSQAQMYSSLGECDTMEKKWESAFDNYNRSVELSSSSANRYFALSGLLQSAWYLSKQEQFNESGNQLVVLFDANPDLNKSGFYKDRLAGILRRCKPNSMIQSNWYEKLYEICTAAHDAAN
jgi:tetratricopeptide (TPR) repeat protein